MAQISPEPGKPTLKRDKCTWGVVTGVIGMVGDQILGNMIVSFDEPSILAIVKNMLMEEFKEITPDVVDAVGEITNMISGGAKKELGLLGYSFNMATPLMIKGKNVEISQLSRSPVITIPFKTPVGQFVLEANLAPRA
jgi:chemotaxis protein CheX